MNVFLFNKENKENDIFLEELKAFASDYGLTVEEVAAILANMAAQQIKQVTV